MEASLYRVHGVVQGVGFRAWAARRAAELQLVGWVRNCRDGTVEVGVAGPPGEVARYRALLERGPSYARVEQVEHMGTPPPDSIGSRFEIR